MAENNPAEIPRTTLPRYAREAAELALQLATLTTEELERMLRTNRQIAATNRRRYRQFHGEEALPALLAYTGVVFRHIAPERFTPGDFEYAQQHLNITSFLYGLLRPLDAIRRYRLEGDAVLPGHDDQTMFGYWQGRLTEAFLEKIHADDGILVNLASSGPTAGVTGSSTAKRPSPRCWPTRASYSGISPRSDSPPGISNTHSSTSTSRRSSTGCSGRWTQSAATGWKGTPYCRGTTTKRCSGTGRDG